MRILLHRGLPIWWQRTCGFLLGLCWCVGLCLGAFFAASVSNIFFRMMHTAQGRASIFGSLMAALLPFLFTAFAVYLSEPRFFLLIAFCKAFCLGFCGVGIGLAYGSAGWLVRFLLLFSDFFLVPVLYWFWMRHISSIRSNARWELAGCSALAVCAGILDYGLITPLTASLIHI